MPGRDSDVFSSTSTLDAKRHRVSVVAIIAAFNEADIIEEVVRDLIGQGIGVYFLDDGSTDGTAEIIGQYAGRGVIGIERCAASSSGSGSFEWARILRRKAQLAQELNADWFIHHDADEFRESPWPQLTLLDAISKVDQLGFNAIDFECLNFIPAAEPDGCGPIRATLTTYAPAPLHDRLQVRCWKRTDAPIDLESSGGHEAAFPNRRIFPIRFLLRHYPLRGKIHGERKVFEERRPRFLAEERERGWHVQYDGLQPGGPLVRDPGLVRPYDPDAVRLELLLRHRGVEALEHEIEASRHARNTLQAELEDVQRILQHAERERDTLQIQLASARTQLLESERKCAGLEELLRSKQDELRVASQERRLASDAFAGLTLRADELQHERDKQAKHISVLETARSSAIGQVNAFRRSLSWRWTAPVRALYRLVTRAPKEKYE